MRFYSTENSKNPVSQVVLPALSSIEGPDPNPQSAVSPFDRLRTGQNGQEWLTYRGYLSRHVSSMNKPASGRWPYYDVTSRTRREIVM